MSIKSDKWIKRMALESRLIDPFIDNKLNIQKRQVVQFHTDYQAMVMM